MPGLLYTTYTPHFTFYHPILLISEFLNKLVFSVFVFVTMQTLFTPQPCGIIYVNFLCDFSVALFLKLISFQDICHKFFPQIFNPTVKSLNMCRCIICPLKFIVFPRDMFLSYDTFFYSLCNYYFLCKYSLIIPFASLPVLPFLEPMYYSFYFTCSSAGKYSSVNSEKWSIRVLRHCIF